MQRERVVLRVEHPGREPGLEVSVRMRVLHVDITAHADTRSLEDLIQSRYGGGFRLGEHRGRCCEERRNSRSKKKLFHCWTFRFGWNYEPASAQLMPDFFLFPINGLSDTREWRHQIPRTCVGHNKIIMHYFRAVGQGGGGGVNPRARLDRRRKTR